MSLMNYTSLTVTFTITLDMMECSTCSQLMANIMPKVRRNILTLLSAMLMNNNYAKKGGVTLPNMLLQPEQVLLRPKVRRNVLTLLSAMLMNNMQKRVCNTAKHAYATITGVANSMS